MDLIGSEVRYPRTDEHRQQSSSDKEEDDGGDVDHDTTSAGMSFFDAQPLLVSPPGSAERLFLVGGVDSSSWRDIASAATDDGFFTARGGADMSLGCSTFDDNDDGIDNNDAFSSTNLTPSSSTIFQQLMTTPVKDNTTTAIIPNEFAYEIMSSPTSGSPDLEHVDAAEKVYEGAKGIWTWGKGIPVAGFFMGVTEGAAGKVIEVATGGDKSKVSDLDGGVLGILKVVDDQVLNPTVHKIASLILGAAGKTEAIFKPILITCMKPIEMILPGMGSDDTAPEATPENIVVLEGKKQFNQAAKSAPIAAVSAK